MLVPVCVIDDFLGPDRAAALRDFAIAGEDRFQPSLINSNGKANVTKRTLRSSLSYVGDTSEACAPLVAAIDDHADRIFAETGTAPFMAANGELELVAHRDGHLFGLHIDTAIDKSRLRETTDRVVSLVYYLHREPKRFSGGNLIIHGLDQVKRRVIEPRHDRLVAFASLAPHEVEPISVPGNGFADARFSVVCWMRRVQPRLAGESNAMQGVFS